MDSYELTERGKIVIAVVLVLLLLVLPSAILAYKAMAGQPSQPPEDQEAAASVDSLPAFTDSPQAAINESPPPDGGGFNQPYVPRPNGQESARPAGSEQSHVDLIEGRLSFSFSPNGQNSLDAETSTMLDEFLTSPKNTPNSLIAVETPQLSYEYSSKLVSVVVDAFSERGVSEQRIAYITDPTVPLAETFEVNLSFITRRPK